MTKLLDIFNAAMAHPRDSAERDAGLEALKQAIMRQARGEWRGFTYRGVSLDDLSQMNRAKICSDYADYVDWAKRAANDED